MDETAVPPAGDQAATPAEQDAAANSNMKDLASQMPHVDMNQIRDINRMIRRQQAEYMKLSDSLAAIHKNLDPRLIYPEEVEAVQRSTSGNYGENPQLWIPVFGHNSSGKSTLINSLIGMNLMPAGSGHTTARICVLSYAPLEESGMLFRRLDDDQNGPNSLYAPRNLEVSFAKVSQKEMIDTVMKELRRPEDPETMGAEWLNTIVELRYPFCWLQPGFSLVDLPGFSMTDKPLVMNLLEKFLRKASVPGLLFCYNNMAFSTAEIATHDFLRRNLNINATTPASIFLVATQCDMITIIPEHKKAIEAAAGGGAPARNRRGNWGQRPANTFDPKNFTPDMVELSYRTRFSTIISRRNLDLSPLYYPPGLDNSHTRSSIPTVENTAWYPVSAADFTGLEAMDLAADPLSGHKIMFYKRFVEKFNVWVLHLQLFRAMTVAVYLQQLSNIHHLVEQLPIADNAAADKTTTTTVAGANALAILDSLYDTISARLQPLLLKLQHKLSLSLSEENIKKLSHTYSVEVFKELQQEYRDGRSRAASPSASSAPKKTDADQTQVFKHNPIGDIEAENVKGSVIESLSAYVTSEILDGPLRDLFDDFESLLHQESSSMLVRTSIRAQLDEMKEFRLKFPRGKLLQIGPVANFFSSAWDGFRVVVSKIIGKSKSDNWSGFRMNTDVRFSIAHHCLNMLRQDSQSLLVNLQSVVDNLLLIVKKMVEGLKAASEKRDTFRKALKTHSSEIGPFLAEFSKLFHAASKSVQTILKAAKYRMIVPSQRPRPLNPARPVEFPLLSSVTIDIAPDFDGFALLKNTTNLTRLSLSRNRVFNDDHLRMLPPSLSELYLPLTPLVTTAGLLACTLPKLELLELSASNITNPPASEVLPFPALKTLHLQASRDLTKLSFLPQTVTHLSLGSNQLFASDATEFPSALVRLAVPMSKASAASLNKLFQRCLSLDTLGCVELLEVPSYLPDRLKSISVQFHKDSVSEALLMQLLGRGLISLNLGTVCLSPSCLQQLSTIPSLLELTIGGCLGVPSLGNQSNLSDELLGYLSQTLTYLRVTTALPERLPFPFFTPNGAHTDPYLPHLVTLILDDGSFIKSTANGWSDLISSLPSTLTHLSVDKDDSFTKVELLKCKNKFLLLSHLELRCSTLLDTAAMEFLPLGLQRLILPQATFISGSCACTLPRTLEVLDLPLCPDWSDEHFVRVEEPSSASPAPAASSSSLAPAPARPSIPSLPFTLRTLRLGTKIVSERILSVLPPNLEVFELATAAKALPVGSPSSSERSSPAVSANSAASPQPSSGTSTPTFLTGSGSKTDRLKYMANIVHDYFELQCKIVLIPVPDDE